MSKVGTKSKVSKYFYQNGESVVITSDIWDRDPYYKKELLPHIGYDYRARTPLNLVSPLNGVVVETVISLWSSYGRQIFIYDEEKNVTVHFAHLSKVNVTKGQKVKQGDLIGVSGRSGKTENAYDAHLHLGLAKGRVATTTKGKHLGDIWLDVEEFDFEYKKAKDKVVILNGARYRSLSKAYDGKVVGKDYIGKEYDYKLNQIKGKDWVYIVELNSYVDLKNVKFTNGTTPNPKPKPQAPKDEYVTVGGRKTLYKASTGSSHYGAKVQSLKSRKMKVLDRKNGRVLVDAKPFYTNGKRSFDKDSFWVVV